MFSSLKCIKVYNEITNACHGLLIASTISLHIFHNCRYQYHHCLMPSCKDYSNIASVPSPWTLFFVFFSPHHVCQGLTFNEHDTCLVQATSFSNEPLQHECALALGHAIEHSTSITYTSHLQLYLSFCKLHNCPTNLTVDTLSFYVSSCVTISTPAQSICLDPLIICTLAGMKKCGGEAPHRRRPLTEEDLIVLFAQFEYPGL